MPVDLAGFITFLKEHAMEHGFHVHDERHFLETYSLRQSWEIDLHPESACNGPLDLNLAFHIEPRVLLAAEDAGVEDAELPDDEFPVPLLFNWRLPALDNPPDLVMLATELAGIGGVNVPIEVSGVDSFGPLSAGPLRELSLTGTVTIPIAKLMYDPDSLCEMLDRAREVSNFLVEVVDGWGPLPPEPEIQPMQ
ncbi:MAG: hypothetical protein KJO36_02140 [Acidimicrobiia bacterium]|nr:hypothetical protein [Acidimicrobiia bacterium]MBT8249367.1 hypothetical protein [Acidimicrobiia bacterium]NNL27540.1 hypothetical protein [Acidimicrobiia bacterium]NNL47136.1 hypothetical protein [Acidimicrobiia bacterium]